MSLVKLALIFLAAHVATALYFLLDRAPGTAAALGGLPLDDAWIHLVYARSLAALDGFAYNPGQLETGSSSPLWAVLLVPATWAARLLGVSVVVPAKITGILTGVGASLGGSRLARGLQLGVAAEIAAGLAIALDPGLAFAQVSGMEVLLAAGLALWAAAELVAEHVWPASVLAALAPLARPEMILISLPVLVGVELRLHRQESRLSRRLLALAPLFLALGSWMVYCLAVSGHPLPSTFYAKVHPRAEYFSHNVALLLEEVVPAWPWFERGAGLALWIVGARVAWRRGSTGALIALCPVAYLLAVAGTQYMLQGRPFYWQRYFLPAVPFLLLGVVAGAGHAVAWAWRGRRAPWALARALAAAVPILGALVGLPTALGRAADLYAWNCQNIDELNVAMARWVGAEVAPGETVAVTDAGAARYFGGHQVLDLVGLNSHRVLHRKSPGALDLETVNWVVSFPAVLPSLGTSAGWQPAHRTSTSHLTICDCPQSELVAYRRVR